MKFQFTIIFVLFSVLSLNGFGQEKDEIYMFSYFINNGEDGLHLAFSTDGMKWQALKNNKSFLPRGRIYLRYCCPDTNPMGMLDPFTFQHIRSLSE